MKLYGPGRQARGGGRPLYSHHGLFSPRVLYEYHTVYAVNKGISIACSVYFCIGCFFLVYHRRCRKVTRHEDVAGGRHVVFVNSRK